MSMQIVNYDDLTDSQVDQAIGLDANAFGRTTGRGAIRLLRKKSGIFSDYYGMFAIEDGMTVGQVIVHRLDYSFPVLGKLRVSGLSGITTRVDRSGRGVARAIIGAVHRREEDAGITHSILWTNYSWHAHELYLSLGYRDIFSHPLAFKRTTRTEAGPGRYRFVRVAKSGLGEIAELHDKCAAGCSGFAFRKAGMISSLSELGEVSLRNLYLVKKGKDTAGYTYMEKNRSATTCRELFVLPGYPRDEIVSAIESAAGKSGAVVFRDSISGNMFHSFESKGYALFPSSWKVLMGTRFGRSMTTEEAVGEFGTSSENFMCQSGDGF